MVTRTPWRKPLQHLRHRLLPRVAGWAIVALSWLPRPVAVRLGTVLGYLGWWMLPRVRSRMLTNLRIALSERTDEAERRRIGLQVLCHCGRTILDNLVLQRWGYARLRDSVPLRGWQQADATVQRELDRGKGVVVVVPHLGNWEIVGGLCSQAWAPACCIAKRYRVQEFQRLVETARHRLGTVVMYAERGLRPALRLLRDGGLLGLLPDLDARRMSGVFVPFFGRQAYTTDTPAQLVLRGDASLLVLTALREGDGYRFYCSGPLQNLPSEAAVDGSSPARLLTERWMAEVERFISHHPEQWVWMHERWKSTPERIEQRRLRREAEAVAARSPDQVSTAPIRAQ